MTEDQKPKDIASMFADEWTLEWTKEHLPELRQSVSGQRFLYQSLVISFVAGLAAHVGGYLLLSSVPSGLLGLLADLLHALGWSLWTGAVVAVFLQIAPEAKRRQMKQWLDAYEALRREKVQAGSNRKATGAEKSHARQAESKQRQKANQNRTRKGG